MLVQNPKDRDFEFKFRKQCTVTDVELSMRNCK